MSAQLPNFTVRSWTDVFALLTLLGMAGAGVMWGLKLDNRTVELETRLAKIEDKLDVGILPRTDERIRSIERRLEVDERDVDRLLRQSPR